MKHILILSLVMVCVIDIFSRSIHRPIDSEQPYITTQWTHTKGPIYTLKSSHLGEYALFKIFNKAFFMAHQLPKDNIPFRYDSNRSIRGAALESQIISLLQEIKEKKHSYTHFTILQKKDFNVKKGCGLLIVQFKKFPFVLKLFIETPESFIHPFVKGIEPIFCFFMGKGINRHLTGFTRLENLHYINQQLSKHPLFSTLVTTPRKWYWAPPQSDSITITGHHIGKKKEQQIEIPGTYALIADTIEAERKLSIFNKKDRRIALAICNYMKLSIDPHIKNFFYEKGTQKIAIVDTEHFPSLVGLEKETIFGSYFAWYVGLSNKCFQNIYLRDKRQRRIDQYKTRSRLIRM